MRRQHAQLKEAQRAEVISPHQRLNCPQTGLLGNGLPTDDRPNRAQRLSERRTNAGSLPWIETIFEIVLATPCWKMNSATKLKTVAHKTASRGDSTRVDTTVAIEFAASWKPLKKSKVSARTTTLMMRMSVASTSGGVGEGG